MKINLPKALQKAIKQRYILSIIQFGSSLQTSKYQDIDLGIVIKKDCYRNFLNAVYGKNFRGFDISLIKEEEVQGPEKFRFGKHGAHFLFSLVQGKTLYGKNPFLRFKVSKYQIKKSILLSLFNYIEDVRKVILKGKLGKNIKRRWPKFLRLCLYLLIPSLEYPDVLSLNKTAIKNYLRKYNIDLDITPKNLKHPKKLFIAYEIIWEKVFKKIDYLDV